MSVQLLAESVPGALPELVADARFVEAFPIAFARRHAVLGLSGGEGGDLAVATADPSDLDLLDIVSRVMERHVIAVPVDREPLLAAINSAYGEREVQADTVLGALESKDVLTVLSSRAAHEDLLDSAGRAPVIQLVNYVLSEAVKQLASDIHLQPTEDKLIVRLRVDGVLFDAFDLPQSVQEEMVSRVKVMAKMDIAEKRLPQDGRATVELGNRVIDLRIASLPTGFGERIVIRLLDKGARLYRLHELGMDGSALALFRAMITVEHGLVLVTGPTGSGKSTTLYAALAELDNVGKNILTLEDPIEYRLSHVSQTQINVKKGLTFAQGLRNVLRQDPDIVMVGEIRDGETATMAIQAALTGHLVFSTLHTNDAASAVTRLLDLGIEPYLVASSLVGVVAQRLVRRVCPHCVRDFELTCADRIRLGLAAEDGALENEKRGAGCPQCRSTGYRGRVGLFELLQVDDEVRGLIAERSPAMALKASALARGTKTLRDDGVQKVGRGLTTVDEVVRVTARAAE